MPTSQHFVAAFEAPPPAALPGEEAALPFYERPRRRARATGSKEQENEQESRADSDAPDADQNPAHSADVVSLYREVLRHDFDWLWSTDAQLNLGSVEPILATAQNIPSQDVIGCNLRKLLGIDQGSEGSLANAIDAHRPFRIDDIALNAGTAPETRYRIKGVPYVDKETGRFAGYRGAGTAIQEPECGGRQFTNSGSEGLDSGVALLSERENEDWRPSQLEMKEFQERLESISHELRTPLNAIMGFAEAIKSRHFGDDPKRYNEYMNAIHESGAHLMDVIDDLFDSNRIGSEQRPLEAEAMDVSELVASALRMLQKDAEKAKVRLVNELSAPIPAVHGDRRAVRQILINLLSNAIKYNAPEGAVGIKSQGALKLTVWDTGVGIAAADCAKVFQRSYRVPEMSKERPGSGLGLAISRELARALHGEITMDSQPGQGSRFTLWLPLDCGQETTSEQQRRQ